MRTLSGSQGPMLDEAGPGWTRRMIMYLLRLRQQTQGVTRDAAQRGSQGLILQQQLANTSSGNVAVMPYNFGSIFDSSLVDWGR